MAEVGWSSPQERDRARLRAMDLFCRLDANHDGSIDLRDLETALREWRLHNPSHANHILEQADINRDGRLDFQEFFQFMVSQERQLRAAFSRIDRNQDGKINARELAEAFRELGLQMSESEAEKMIGRLDRDGTLSIDFREFFDFFLFSTANVRSLLRQWRKSTFLQLGDDEPFAPDEMSEEEMQTGVWWRNLLSGGLAGAVSRTCTAPLDRLKVILQVYGSKHKNITLVGGLQHMMREGGLRSMWRGNLINVLKIAPESGIKFWAYEQMKSRVKQASRRAGLSSSDELEVCERFVSGASAGIIAQSSIYPLEVLKTKLCVRKTGEYTNVWDCILKTYRRDGLIAFYRGYVPNIVGIIPYAGIDLTIYETLKKHFIRRMKERQAAITATAAPLQAPVASNTAFPVPSNNHRTNGHREAGGEPVPGVLLLLACGTISSTCGQLVSYPLALIRTRLQAHPKHEHEVNWLRMVSNIWDEEGFRGLYRGLVPNFLKVAPAVSVSYVVYEYTRRALGVRQ